MLLKITLSLSKILYKIGLILDNTDTSFFKNAYILQHLWPKSNNCSTLSNPQFCSDILPITSSRGKILITLSYPVHGISVGTTVIWPSPMKDRIYISSFGNRSSCLSLDRNNKGLPGHILSHLTTMMENSLRKKLIHQRCQSKEVERCQWYGSVNNQFLSNDKFWR